MKAAILQRPKEFTIRQLEVPKVREHEVLVAVKYVGICGTDRAIFQGQRKVKYPLIIGHECSGQVVEIAEGVSGLRKGDRVTVQPIFSCQKCFFCKIGRPNLCENRESIGYTINGCFCEYVKAPESYVWKLPQTLQYTTAAMVEPVAVAVRAVKRSLISSGESVAVLGVGVIGSLILQIAKQIGGKVFAIDVVNTKLDLAKEFGADATINTTESDPVEAIGSLTKGKGVDIVIEAAGVPETIEESTHIVRNGGKIVLVGQPLQPVTLDFLPVVRKEIKIIGSLTYTREFATAIYFMECSRVKVQPLITKTYTLDDINRAFKNSQEMKVLINCSSS